MQKQRSEHRLGPPDLSQGAIEAVAKRVARWDYERRRTDLVAMEKLINASYGDDEARGRIEAAMINLLAGDATLASKQFVCKKLWIIGTERSVPALAALLASSNQVLVEAGCYALRTQPSAAASQALRGALGKARSESLVAIVNVIGDRRDVESVRSLSGLTGSEDAMVADAAICALGKIASPEAVQALRNLNKPNGVRRGDAAHALLQAAQELAKHGKSDAARALYSELRDGAEAPHIRRGAETALKRLA